MISSQCFVLPYYGTHSLVTNGLSLIRETEWPRLSHPSPATVSFKFMFAPSSGHKINTRISYYFTKGLERTFRPLLRHLTIAQRFSFSLKSLLNKGHDFMFAFVRWRDGGLHNLQFIPEYFRSYNNSKLASVCIFPVRRLLNVKLSSLLCMWK